MRQLKKKTKTKYHFKAQTACLAMQLRFAAVQDPMVQLDDAITFRQQSWGVSFLSLWYFSFMQRDVVCQAAVFFGNLDLFCLRCENMKCQVSCHKAVSAIPFCGRLKQSRQNKVDFLTNSIVICLESQIHNFKTWHIWWLFHMQLARDQADRWSVSFL